MKYFSGFCLKNEQSLFDKYLIKSDFNIVGFSYGAIKAIKFVLESKIRIDTLQLISPAFFNDKSNIYKNAQLKAFSKDGNDYLKTFLKQATNYSKIAKPFFIQGTKEQLKELLFFNWSKDIMDKILNKNIRIEIFLGGKDNIVSSHKSKDFFSKFGNVYFHKNCDHFLLE